MMLTEQYTLYLLASSFCNFSFNFSLHQAKLLLVQNLPLFSAFNFSTFIYCLFWFIMPRVVTLIKNCCYFSLIVALVSAVSSLFVWQAEVYQSTIDEQVRVSKYFNTKMLHPRKLSIHSLGGWSTHLLGARLV